MDRLQQKLEELKQITLNSFPTNVAGIYVHGSVAMNSFNSASSDIDILVVIHKPLTKKEKKDYLYRLIAFSNDLDMGKGLELSVVLAKKVRNFVGAKIYFSFRC